MVCAPSQCRGVEDGHGKEEETVWGQIDGREGKGIGGKAGHASCPRLLRPKEAGGLVMSRDVHKESAHHNPLPSANSGLL